MQFQFVERKGQGDIGAYGCEVARKQYLLFVVGYLVFQRTFELVFSGEQCVDSAELFYKCYGGFFAHSRAARYVVRAVAH